MTKTTTNVGVTGTASIRIGDMRICDLPIGESALASRQLPLAEDTERQNKIEDVLVASPKQRVSYLQARVKEAEENIDRIADMKRQQQQLISDYTSQISLCEFRDKEIERISADDPDRDNIIRDLKKRFPPYNVSAMEQQIKQSNESIERADDVIGQEYKAIAELREYLVLCQARDARLRALGVKVEAG